MAIAADPATLPTTDPAPALAGEPPAAQEAGLPASSLLAQLQARRREAATEKRPTLTVIIPGYEGKLAAVYRYPEGGAEIAMKAAEREKSGAKDARLDASADLLIACIASLVGRRADGQIVNLQTDEVIPAEDVAEVVLDPTYPALRFNKTGASALAIDTSGEIERVGRYVCRHVFSPRFDSTGIYEGDMALVSQSNVLFSWLQDTEGLIESELTGE